jgi:uncharacterized zinc-type alcohol dehydrogenase-like protein
MSEIHSLAAKQPKGKLEPFSYDPGPLGDEQVEIEVQYCGICHSYTNSQLTRHRSRLEP